jgi:hypothetical protein
MHTAITALKSGEKNLARNYLERLLTASGDYDTMADAWFYLSEASDDPLEKRKALENALSYRMTHPRARRALAILDGKLKEDEVIDPDAMPAPDTNDREADADRFTCPNCGGKMVFSPDGQSLVCEYCTSGGRIASASEATEEQDFFTAMATLRGHSKPVAQQIFHCQGCGADFLLPPDSLSASCAYCASPHVISLEETRELLDPDAIIPVAFGQRQATHLLIKWVQEQGFTPQGKVLPPRGVYLPVWTFDIGGGIRYSGQRYEEEDIGFQRRTVVKTERGEYPVYIDDLLIPASRAQKSYLLRVMDTYRLREAKPYDARYLSSWPASAYDFSLADASLEARSLAYKQYQKRVRADFSHLENLHMASDRLAIDSYKLLLLPVWMTSYPFGEQDYSVLINGQTGQVIGETPKHKAAGKSANKLRGWLDDLLER